MISCQTFRANLQPGTHDADLLEHLRHCDACLDFAVQVDPDCFFRALGGDELVPPGGVDAFVGDVMAQVRSREIETAAEPRHTFSNMRRLAIAATLAAAVSTGLVVSNRQSVKAPTLSTQHAARSTPLVTKPIVETYESSSATIIEVPSESKGDVQVVMIFDESLPADL
jgi:hypothetical protein